jgi:hypothetical protein
MTDNMDSILDSLKSSDPNTILSALSTLGAEYRSGKCVFTVQTANAIGEMLRDQIGLHISQGIAENILYSIKNGIFVEVNENTPFNCEAFTSSETFLSALLLVLKGFWTKPQSCFQSHLCFESGLLILLNFVESSKSIGSTVSTMQQSGALEELLNLLGSQLSNDICYHTQVISIGNDIVCCLFILSARN